MLVQTDVTPRVELENKLADLTDAQLSMLEQLFPRHIIEYMLARVPGGRGTRDHLRTLANTHEQVGSRTGRDVAHVPLAPPLVPASAAPGHGAAQQATVLSRTAPGLPAARHTHTRRPVTHVHPPLSTRRAPAPLSRSWCCSATWWASPP